MSYSFIEIDKPQDWADIQRIQADAYSPELQEDIEALKIKAEVPNNLCRLVISTSLKSKQVEVMGYVLAHAYPPASAPPLNADLSEIEQLGVEQNEQNLFLHDFCLHSDYQGLGAGRKVIQQFVELAKSAAFTSISLVAVQGSSMFWGGLGFNQIRIDKSLNSYGNDAVFMMQAL